MFMKPSHALGSGFAAAILFLSGAAPAVDTTAQAARQAGSATDRAVIVIMKNHHLTGAEAESDRAPLLSRLTQSRTRGVKRFQSVNSFATTVSPDELASLATDPNVAMIVPDVMIRRAKLHRAAAPSASPGTALTPNVIPGACGANGKVLLDPEALQTTNTHSDDPQAKTARSLGITGKGVKVAWIADGLDTQNVNFIRPSTGKSVFVDYQVFAAEGAGQITGGGEAFLDANSIAGQGAHVYNVQNFGAQSDPSACNIRIEGMAPGADLVGLNVFSTFDATTESNFLQAIDYAIFTAHVDVINESFGSNPFPDTGSLDATKVFNDAAVKAGITVTVSTGDAGFTNTIGSPATDPLVISVGGSTAFRFYAQTNYAAARYFAKTGWLNDNISSLSSSGYTQAAGTLDLVAPGDLGFASCAASPNFFDCTNFPGNPSDVEEAGGTSESAPLTAGAAALVIEAYRKAHHGDSPTPALVKQILTSTATDLGVPAAEQGAGLINSYKAVLLAQSIKSGQAPIGNSLLLSQNQLNAIGNPGSVQRWPVAVTNTGAQAQTIRLTGKTFGAHENVQSGSVTLQDGTSPEFANYQGLQNNYAVIHFHVPNGADRLSASIAYPAPVGANNNARVRLILVDPLGRFAAHSLPQGVGNFGNVDVRQPAAGTWTGVIFGDVESIGGTNGKVPWQVFTQRFTSFGSVSPNTLALRPGQSATFQVTASMPRTPGDSSGSIVLTSSGGGVDPFLGAESNSIPVTLRSLVNVSNGGSFQGVLTGGNGRPPGEGQVNYFGFDVGRGHSSITANVTLQSDIGDVVGAYLIAPDGTALGFGQNSVNGVNTPSITAYTHNPAAGRWTLIVEFAGAVVGDEISQTFTGNIQLDDVSVSAPGLPNSTHTMLAAGTPVTVPVRITNNGAAAEQFFVDARLNSTAVISLANLSPPPAKSGGYPLPLAGPGPQWLMPTQTTSMQVVGTATVPIEFDYGPDQGDPDLVAGPVSGTQAAGQFAPGAGIVQQGLWFATPDEFGPFAGPAPSGLSNFTMTAKTKAFDPAVTSAPGDLWLAAVSGAALASFAPVIIEPGQTVIINVKITPAGPSGTVVSGNLYVDDAQSAVPPYGQLTGSELAAIPYTYTIK
jgi:hypothetical protein